MDITRLSRDWKVFYEFRILYKAIILQHIHFIK
jgi:hypothetical protein